MSAAMERWEKAARAASFLLRAADARTATQAGWLLEESANLLCEVGLQLPASQSDIANQLFELADDTGFLREHVAAAAEGWYSDADIYELHARALHVRAALHAAALLYVEIGQQTDEGRSP